MHNLDYTEHGSVYKLDYNFDALTGNLKQRDVYNYLTGTHNREKFEFDFKDRLSKGSQHDPLNTDALIAGSTNQVTIDEKGNITHKDDAGDYVYSNATKPFNLTQINNPTSNVSLNTLGVTYNDLRKTSQLNETVTGKQINLEYGNDDERIKMEYQLNGVKQYTRYYHANYELEEKPNGDVTEWVYINAPTGLTAIHKTLNNTNKQLFTTLCDHLGSPVLLTDNNQNIVDEFSFDAWGRKRNVTDWSYTSITNNSGLNRGFTFHEHIDEFNLINMNGRIYDPVLGRFLQPDNQVQQPTNLQTFNKYSYAANNPLSYTDPSGWGWGSDNTSTDWSEFSGAHGLSAEYNNYSEVGIPPSSYGGGGGGGLSGGIYARTAERYKSFMNGDGKNRALRSRTWVTYKNVKKEKYVPQPLRGKSKDEAFGAGYDLVPDGYERVAEYHSIPAEPINDGAQGGGSGDPYGTGFSSAQGVGSGDPYGTGFSSAQGSGGGGNGDGWGLSFYSGVPIISSPLVQGAGFTPGPFVVTPPGVHPNSNKEDRDFIRHEVGHVATFVAMGASFPLYISLIAIPSAINFHFPNQFGGPHDSFYTEKVANTFSEWMYGPFTGRYKNTYPSYNTPRK